MRNIDSQAQMAMLQGFAKDLIANVQAGDTQMSAAEPGGDGDEDLLDFMRKLEEDLVAEMMEQEQEMVRQYLEHEEQEDNALVQAAQSQEVVCPVCLRGPLFRNANVFFCQCGMRLSLMSDQLSLEQLQANIQQGFSGHAASGCCAQPAAAVQACGGYDMLVMACAACDYMDILA